MPSTSIIVRSSASSCGHDGVDDWVEAAKVSEGDIPPMSCDKPNCSTSILCASMYGHVGLFRG